MWPLAAGSGVQVCRAVQCFGVGVVDGVLVVALAGGGVWCWCVQVPL